MPSELGASQMLEIWGLRRTGGRFTSPYSTATGGDAEADYAEYVTDYIEKLAGFGRAKEALRWRYVEGREPADFPLRGPGETLARALIRRRWGMHLGTRASLVCAAVLADFTAELCDAILARPPLTEEQFATVAADRPHEPETDAVKSQTW